MSKAGVISLDTDVRKDVFSRLVISFKLLSQPTAATSPLPLTATHSMRVPPLSLTSPGTTAEKEHDPVFLGQISLFRVKP